MAAEAKEHEEFLAMLQIRFEQHPKRHLGIMWADVQERLLANEVKLSSLRAMEKTGGEPDVVVFDAVADAFTFCDCSPESPEGRRNLCYDQKAWDSRKRNKPQGSAVSEAESMGIQLLTESQYQSLQELGEFDMKTSSWIETPEEVRKKGGALFCDRRFGRVFTFHNGAESYYGARGFRGSLQL